MLGRPPLTEEQKNEIVRKLEPYLKAGLSIKKACAEANIPKSTVYDYMESDEAFSDHIRHIEYSLSITLSMTFLKQLEAIKAKQENSTPLNKEDLDFLKWFALNSNLTKEEYGRRETINSFDPEIEIQKIKRLIEENFTEDIEHLD